MDPKITMLFMLIGAVVGFSHLSEENLAKIKRRLEGGRWHHPQKRTFGNTAA